MIDSLRRPMSNTEVVIALAGDILTGRPLFTRELPANVSHDEWRQLHHDVIEAELQWS